ncbi:hypothetical protein [Hansschlegelia zhihuaiae]|uniref:Uncharacterized protein n=1 Tax=Hansschlegelia zhihuaiae TaxID=405005 RepID=A0A4Q0MMQ7_9HYPH|nr:hypothetical protein [Hansschlegelia zhihuaiae]RXF75050.1 hypothetical protein EK403_03105 [Hansschlegelia zhihuaiae]
MTASTGLDPAPDAAPAKAANPGVPSAPLEVVARATGLKGALADDVAGRIVLALGEAGWWFVHDAQPGKRTGYRGGRPAVAGEG